MNLNCTVKAAFFGAVFLFSAAISASGQQTPIQPRMGEPLPGLTAGQLQRFFTGKVDGFDHIFSVAEGLGPVMNDTACAGCHLGPTSGGGSGKFVTRFGIAGGDCNSFDALDGSGPSGLNFGGSLLQALSINTPTCDEAVPSQATIEIHRVTPPVFGFGLVEAIDDADIQALEASPPKPWISGRTHMVQPLEGPAGLRAGRFGWKAQVATVLTFSGDASKNEQGITNDLDAAENAPGGDAMKLATCDTVPEPEDLPDGFGFRRIDRMTDFQRFLAAPPQTPKAGMTGEALFVSIGCADCHVATGYTTMTTSYSGGPLESALAGKTLKPYSDFLLHDIGTGDGVIQGGASGCEFRTPPLWGLRVRAGNGLLHDGNGKDPGIATPDNNVRFTIGLHLNEGNPSRVAFNGLSASDQQKVLDFLASLGRPEFDTDGDNDVSIVDWFVTSTNLAPNESHFTGPIPTYNADSFAAVADIDQDGDIDLVDFAAFQRAISN